MAAMIKPTSPAPPPVLTNNLIRQPPPVTRINMTGVLEPAPFHDTPPVKTEPCLFNSSAFLPHADADIMPEEPLQYTLHSQDVSAVSQYPAYQQRFANPDDDLYRKNLSAHFDAADRSPSSGTLLEELPNLRSITALRNTQSGRQLPRVLKTPRMRKGRKEKAKATEKTAKLEKALSELTKGWTHIPVVDVESYVNRSVKDRLREVEESKNGRVKRPMNSFMLYRKAYQNRCKEWCLKNNHQVVSQLCGESWPLESEPVRQQFNEWAKIERTNHQKAHPGYKFSPSKPGTANKPAKRHFSEEVSEESGLDDFDWKSGQSMKSRKRRRSTPWSSTSSPRLQGRLPETFSPDARPAYASDYNRSAYQVSNPGRLMPQQYGHGELPSGHRYEQAVYKQTSCVEDVLIRRADVAGGVPFSSGYVTEPAMAPMHDFAAADGSLGADNPFDFVDHYIPPPPEHAGAGSYPAQTWVMPNEVFPDTPGLSLMPGAADALQTTEQDIVLPPGNQDAWHIVGHPSESATDYEWQIAH